MKLSDHVDKIRNLITASFDKQFARLGIGANKQIELEKLPEQVRAKRKHLEVMLENHIGETGCYQDAREKLLDELSFTLFNRLAAVKVMESANLFPPVITKQAEHGGRSFGHKAWLEEYPENRKNELEGIRDYFKHAFNELGDSLSLYSKEYPYALLPDAISLNEIVEAFNVIAEDSQVEDDIWQSDDVLGWLYESYNNAKKQAFKESKAKTEYDKVSLQSQVYTPRWVVQFLVENSLGKLYLEMYPESDIKNQFKIANAPKIQERELKPLHEIKLIDPSSGSGNFLLYAFDVFYELYIDQIENYDADYDEDEIPKLIIENNLHGIDLDDRAIQLAQLGLYIKARKKRRFINGSFNFNVISSDFYLPPYGEARHIFEDSGNLDNTQKELIEDIWNDLRYAYKFGSLIRLDEKLKAKLNEVEAKQGDKVLDLFADADIREQKDFTESFFNNLKVAVEKFTSTNADTFIASKTRDAITFLELLTTEYDVACANPPYTDSADFGNELKVFIDNNYKKPFQFHINLYASFLKRCFELTSSSGKVAMLHPHTFMFIKTFEGVRKYIIEKSHVDVMVDYGLDRVNLFGPGILLDATFYILSKSDKKEDGIYFEISKNLQEKYKKEKFSNALSNYISNEKDERVYLLSQSKLKIIKSWPFIYWISEDFRKMFKLPPIADKADIKSGLATANNDRFLRYWWEVSNTSISTAHSEDKQKWVRYAKGGTFNKWYGNLWLVVNYGHSGEEMRATGRAVFRNKEYYFNKGITYSATSTKGTSFRVLPHNCIYDVKGASAFVEKDIEYLYAIALFNSKLNSYIVGCLNSTVETQVGDIKRVPYASPTTQTLETFEKLVEQNIEIKKMILSSQIVEPNFDQNPIDKSKNSSIELRIKDYLNEENYLLTTCLLNEVLLDEEIFSTYNLTNSDKAMVIDSEGVSIGALPVCPEARSAFIENSAHSSTSLLPNVKSFIESLPSNEFDDEFKNSITLQFSELYQKNNDLESFCINHNVNPINVWHWFRGSLIIPSQRKLKITLEYLASNIEELLQEDACL